MRAIPAAVETLLKSRSMVGDDRPAYKITIDGSPGGDYSWQTATTPIRPDTSANEEANVSLSAVEINDGSVLCMYARGSSIYQATAADLNTFITTNNSLTGEALVLSGLNYAKVTVFYSPSNELMFSYSGLLSAASNKTAESKIYKCNVGDGSDWAEYATVYTISTTTTSTVSVYPIPARIGMGLPLFLSSGRWVLPHPGWKYMSGSLAQSSSGEYCDPWSSISTSDDNGITWTRRYNWGKGIGVSNDQTSHHSRNLGLAPNGDLWWASYDSGATIQERYFKSTNSGETWTNTFTFSHSVIADIRLPSIVNDDSGMYALRFDQNNGPLEIYELPQTATAIGDLVDTTYTIPLVGRNTHKDTNLIASTIGNTLVLIGSSAEQNDYVAGVTVVTDDIKVKSINISRNRGMAGQLNLVLDNKDGRYSPDKSGSDWEGVLKPNVQVEVEQGYGTNLVRTFTGLIDCIDMRTFPQELELSHRDAIKRALDQTITDTGGDNTVTFTDETIEDIFTTLCGWAGLTVNAEATGITLAEITFSNETYGDAFGLLAEIANFEYFADEEFVIQFQYQTDRQPESEETITLDDDVIEGIIWYDLDHSAVVSGSQRVTSPDELTIYTKDVDYEIDITNGRIKRIDTGLIADGTTILIKYVYPAWIFREGEDIVSLGYTIDDKKIYKKIIVYGQDSAGDVISAEKEFEAPLSYNVLDQKILFINANNADTEAKCQEIANRTEYIMRSKGRIVYFAAIANPYLQLGDCVQVIESSTTISEIYRIDDFSTSQQPDGTYLMSMTCHYYGFAPV